VLLHIIVASGITIMKIFAIFLVQTTLALSLVESRLLSITPPPPPPPPGSLTRSANSIQNTTSPPPPCSTNDHVASARIGIIAGRYRWENFFVFIDPAFSDAERNVINQATWELSQALPCVRFGVWPRGGTPFGDYVRITKNPTGGCWATLGRIGGRQDLNLGDRCVVNVVVVHEMMHALGVHHEHVRPDRDLYINVHRENIQQNWQQWYNTLSPNEYSTYGVPYNSRSIMHYSSFIGSINNRPTMTLKNGQTISYNYGLQQTDIQKLRAMYGC